MAKILVTGGAGFIGSHLVERLVKEGHDLVVCDILLRGNKLNSDILNKIEFHKMDVRDLDGMVRISWQCNYVYHFAAVLGVDVVADNPVETMDTEIIGMQNIVNACLTNGINKLVYASTSGIYGHSALADGLTETVVVDPRTSYAIAKRYNEIYLAAHHDEKGLESISLRFFNVYGPKQDNRMVIPRFIEQAKSGRDLTVFGDGMQTRDFTYINDTIDVCVSLLDKIKGAEIYNVANEQEYTIKELAEQIIKSTNSDSDIRYIAAPKKRYDYEVGRRIGNSTKLHNKIGFKPVTQLEEGLKSLI